MTLKSGILFLSCLGKILTHPKTCYLEVQCLHEDTSQLTKGLTQKVSKADLFFEIIVCTI